MYDSEHSDGEKSLFLMDLETRNMDLCNIMQVAFLWRMLFIPFILTGIFESQFLGEA